MKKISATLIALFSPFLVLAYAQPTTSDVYCASGFGDSTANGTYTYDHTHNDGGQSDFVFATAGGVYLGFYEYPNNLHDNVVIGLNSPPSNFPSNNDYTSSTGVFGTWNVGGGSSPAGTVVNGSCAITPSTSTATSTLVELQSTEFGFIFLWIVGLATFWILFDILIKSVKK